LHVAGRDTPCSIGLLCCGLFSCQQSKKPPVSNATQQQSAVPETADLASEPSFPGGNAEWAKYLTREIEANIDDLSEENISGTVVVSFTVDTSGQVSNARVESCCETGKKDCASPDTKLAQVA
jgi:outer membrane biosynthesis protein TonB